MMASMNATATSRAATARPAWRATTKTSASLLSSARCSSSPTTAAFGRALPSHRVSSHSNAFPAARRPARFSASARSSGLAVRAVLDVDESTFEEEVLKVSKESSFYLLGEEKEERGNAFSLQAPAFLCAPFFAFVPRSDEQRGPRLELKGEEENAR